MSGRERPNTHIKGIDEKELQEVFDARNQIAHEMDATPQANNPGERKMRPRKWNEMYDYTEVTFCGD